MSEVLLPTWIIPEEETQEWLDEGSSVFRGAFAPGLAQRQSYGGLRLKLSRKHTVRGEEKAQLLSILKSTKGSYNALRTKVHFALRGSFPASELLANGMFASGTTGWTSDLEYTLGVSDRVMRPVRNAFTDNGYFLQLSSAASVTQYAPHVARFFVVQGRGGFPTGFRTDGVTTGTASTGFGLKTQTFIPVAATMGLAIADLETTGVAAGDYLLVPYASLSPCALVDTSPNSLLRSDQLESASWTKTRTTVTANAATGPQGGTVADAIVEDSTVASTHHANQAATGLASADRTVTVCGFFKRGAGTRNVNLGILNSTSMVNGAIFNFNLGTGAVGAISLLGTGAEARSSISDAGNGWYFCSATCRIGTADTGFQMRAYLHNGTTDTYNGDGVSSIYAWRLGGGVSGSAFMPGLTEGSVNTGTSYASSNALRVKGLTASTNGLLLPEDIFAINGELKHATAALNSDAAGLGYLQFEPPLIRSPANDDPVIVTDPMGKFLVSDIKIDNEFGTQAIVTYDLEHIYE